ncbi:MAG: ABC transporter [Bdellovibrionales bacterium RIFOXYD12_FULL_39_22]|nr:MAG: ABC transporter [Bdellovibrionales bacterium RIFOXYB1_FULL_39_21]OFZ42703.1 MAG: ABC transporter [Bdellovibrionales bacterium RIFOXYC12_FULL_39_17]OFZ47262.1 MAG: ABC transporter [Bdellovibrionales bacterium RIFOXYC1_FULL_39_130]OFZ75428.1 MAG: ABC transporter [Bdellovibrionales bacterium RIFOXYD1_FULL_39_84]OFZ93382.1 MAG: ABC transporter [Bdellovibrionales bacterium RIFOXYD12_FULL_39_22]HLE12353.1 ABC transporter ATP-binding protein [Bacteriovoracaceae bacterium]
MKSIALKDVVKNYYLGEVVVPALKSVNLNISSGEFTVIAGPSGSGKTTLLNLVGCVDTATAGIVSVGDEDTAKLSERKLTDLRLHTIGFIFQNFNLISVLNVYDNVEFPLLLRTDISKKERRERTLKFISQVGLEGHMHHRPNELSGGQRQRVAIARALVSSPKIVLADEPTANLDSVTGQKIIDLMKEINEKEKTTFLFSTHDEKIISHARRVIRILDGQIVTEQ